MSSSKKDTLNRRRFLQITGGAALATPLGAGILASQTRSDTVLQPSPEQPVDATTSTRPAFGFDAQINQMETSLKYLDQAIVEAPGIYGQREVLAQHWEEGRTYYSQTQAQLLVLGFQLQQVVDPDVEPIDGVFPVDLVTPLPTLDVFLADENAILVNLQPVAAGMDVKKVIGKLLGVLGIKEASQAIFELLDEDGLIKELDDAITARNMKKIGEVLKKILEKFVSKDFLRRLGNKIGAKAAAKIVGKVTARFIPFVGWALLIGSLLWAIGEQIFS